MKQTGSALNFDNHFMNEDIKASVKRLSKTGIDGIAEIRKKTYTKNN